VVPAGDHDGCESLHHQPSGVGIRGEIASIYKTECQQLEKRAVHRQNQSTDIVCMQKWPLIFQNQSEVYSKYFAKRAFMSGLI
jgi:hypothetical protein